MKVLGNRVLVEQIMTKKKSALVSLNAKKDSEENFDIKKIIIGLGPDVDTDRIAIGDIPIFGKYAEPAAIKVLSKDDNEVKAHLIMDYDNIVGIEEDIV